MGYFAGATALKSASLFRKTRPVRVFSLWRARKHMPATHRLSDHITQSEHGCVSTANPMDRDIGRHDAQIDRLEVDVASMVAEMKQIRTILDRADGGWRALMWVAGVSGSIGAAVSWIGSRLYLQS